EALSLVRPNVVKIFADDRIVATWRVDDLAWTFHSLPKIEFHTEAGEYVNIRFVSHASPMIGASEPRPLAVPLRNVTVRRKNDSRPCEVNTEFRSFPGPRPWR